MHNQLLILSMAGLLSLAIAACEKKQAKQVATNITSEPHLNGRYLGPCQASGLMSLSSRTQLTFSGNLFTSEESFYNSDKCSEKEIGGSITKKGTFVVDDAKLDGKGKGLMITFAEATITPQKNFLLTALNTTKFCGRSDYKPGVKADISKGTKELLCPVGEVPKTLYGSYRLEGKQLFLNRGGVDEMNTNKAKRPKDLDSKDIYVHQ